MTDNSAGRRAGGGSLETRNVEALHATLGRLRLEIAELHASRERLLLAADEDRRVIERELHDGVQQHLVALAVDLELATRLADTDPPAAKSHLREMERSLQQALDESAQLAQRIFPPMLDARGLGAALRAAATSAPISARVEVIGDAGGASPELTRAVYFCVLAALEQARAGAEVTVTVRGERGALVFEVAERPQGSEATATSPDPPLDRLRDRIEALGGTLTVVGEPGGATRVSGSLPLSR